MYLSWIIPAHNEASRIEKTLREVDAYLRSKNFPGGYEILVVDNTSEDETPGIVERLKGEIQGLRLLRTVGPGKGWAVKAGMREAQGEILMFSDADNSVSPEQADNFLPLVCMGGGLASVKRVSSVSFSSQDQQRLKDKIGTKPEYGTINETRDCFDVVIGSIEISGAKIKEQAQWYRRILGKLAKYVIRVVSGLWEIRDSQRGFKFFSRRAAEVIFPRQTLTGWGFDFEILLIAKRRGFKIKEVPVIWINPPGSKVRLSAYFTTLLELLRIKWNDLRGVYGK